MSRRATSTTRKSISNMADQQLLAIARANQAKRRFQLSLQDLCVRVVANNENLFVSNAGLSYRLGNLAPLMKSRILAELSRQICNDWLRYSATKNRSAMLKLLINGRLQEFDFAVCGESDEDGQQVWQCLVESAAQSLRTVRDLRWSNLSASYTRDEDKSKSLLPCLPFVAQLPHLENLHITAFPCRIGDLEQLAKAAPNLKKLHLQLERSFCWQEVKVLFTMAALEEVEFGGVNETIENIIPELMRHMPQLKVNCFRADNLYPYYHTETGTRMSHDETAATLTMPLNLEHCSISLSSNWKNFHQLSKVKHLMIGDDSYPIDEEVPAEDYTRYMRHLCGLNLRHLDFFYKSVPILRVNGKGITTLTLDAMNQDYNVNEFFDLYLAFAYCPALKSLTVRGGVLTVDPTSPDVTVPKSKDLQLKKLRLIDSHFYGSNIFCWLLAAPMLEELEMEDLDYYRRDLQVFDRANMALKSGTITLANLHTLKISVETLRNIEVVESACKLAKTMLIFGQKLQQVDLSVTYADIRFWKQNNLGEYTDLVNKS